MIKLCYLAVTPISDLLTGPKTFSFMIYIVTSIIMIMVGWLIWKKGRLDLIRRPIPEEIKDKKKYSKAVGIPIFVLGIWIAMSQILLLIPYFKELKMEWLMSGGIFILTLLIILTPTFYSERGFRKKEN